MVHLTNPIISHTRNKLYSCQQLKDNHQVGGSSGVSIVVCLPASSVCVCVFASLQCVGCAFELDSSALFCVQYSVYKGTLLLRSCCSFVVAVAAVLT